VFTGLIEEVGHVRAVEDGDNRRRLHIEANTVLEDARIGDSITVNGACQTVVEMEKSAAFVVESVAETLRRTTLGDLKPGDPVNLERSLRLQDRLGGHLVAGHVDGVGVVDCFEQRQGDAILEVEAPTELQRYIASKGSIAIDGISLTVVDVTDTIFTVAIIPHTLQHTNLSTIEVRARVNLEVDLVARYVERLYSGRSEAK
jgi:riboflavin synthase